MLENLPQETQKRTRFPFDHFVFWCMSFSSILILLLHLDGTVDMASGAWFILFPAAIIMTFILVRAYRLRDREFLRRIFLGFWGGLIGTLGYDVFRIPFHYAGMNVFSPIYAYGMWICGFEQATTVSDIVGFTYHLSNGITFGWIYSILLDRPHLVVGLVVGDVARNFSGRNVFRCGICNS